MGVTQLAAVVRERSRLRSHDRWSHDEVVAHQAGRLADLRAFAVARSPFYRELHRGLTESPLSALPTVTKATLMERFDDLVTDREIHLRDVERYLDTAAATDRFLGRYRVAATGGTTGRRGVFLADPAEWTSVLASYSRAYAWAGVDASITKRLRMAVVSSRNPTHQSAIVGATVASRVIPTLRLEASAPMDEVVAELNAFRPDAIVGYASVLRLLAGEQSAGRLNVRPTALMSASEVLTSSARAAIQLAFGVRVSNVYAATETAGIASECKAGHLHRYEDLVIAEIVDEDGQPVPDGQMGAKLLVSVLFSRTQPLIRYELSDRVAAEPGLVGDLPYAVLRAIEGREEETITVGGVTVHPNVFHAALERLPVSGWQIVQEPDRLVVLLADGRDIDTKRVADSVGRALEAVGAVGAAIAVELVDQIPRTALGKSPLIRRSTPALASAIA